MTPVLVINVLGRITAAFLALRAIAVWCKRSHELAREAVGESLIGELIGALKQRTARYYNPTIDRPRAEHYR